MCRRYGGGMEVKMVRIGIIGLGGISQKHLRELCGCDNVEVVALCDIDPSAIERAKEKFCLHRASCYSDYRDLIADPCVEAVEICTPNYLHAQMAIAALEAGKHVNLEKPVAMSYEEALTIVDAEKKSEE